MKAVVCKASFSNALNVIPHIANGSLKGLAITGDRNFPVDDREAVLLLHENARS